MKNPLYTVSKVIAYATRDSYAVRLCCPFYANHYLFGVTRSDSCCCEIIAMDIDKEAAVELGKRMSRRYFALFELK